MHTRLNKAHDVNHLKIVGYQSVSFRNNVVVINEPKLIENGNIKLFLRGRHGSV